MDTRAIWECHMAEVVRRVHKLCHRAHIPVWFALAAHGFLEGEVPRIRSRRGEREIDQDRHMSFLSWKTRVVSVVLSRRAMYTFHLLTYTTDSAGIRRISYATLCYQFSFSHHPPGFRRRRFPKCAVIASSTKMH